MNADRALAFVRQALGRAAELRGLIILDPTSQGVFVSLVRNLESAEADLVPPQVGT